MVDGEAIASAVGAVAVRVWRCCLPACGGCGGGDGIGAGAVHPIALAETSQRMAH